MAFSNLPRPITVLLKATESHDVDEFLRTFADDAVLTDKGNKYCGANAIKNWSDSLFSSGNVAIRPINVAKREGRIVVTLMIRHTQGEAVAADPIQRDWWFAIRDDRISALAISQEKALDLPVPVAAYVQGTNSLDLDTLLGAFADDALVNDQLRDYWGKSAIREWAARDIVGDRMAMYVVKAVEHYGHVIVTANVDGDYDKRGLPDPLVLTFYFSAHRDKIVQLIILRNHPNI